MPRYTLNIIQTSNAIYLKQQMPRHTLNIIQTSNAILFSYDLPYQ